MEKRPKTARPVTPPPLTPPPRRGAQPCALPPHTRLSQPYPPRRLIVRSLYQTAAKRTAPLLSAYQRIPAPCRNLPFALFFAAILSYGGFFAYYLLSHSDIVNFVAGFNNDDAFYYFQIAKNLAAGQFSTFDGGITQTNGYHPVWALLLTPLYWAFDPGPALAAIKALEIMLIAGSVAMIALAAWLSRLPWILLFAALPALYTHRALYLGMEAAAVCFALGSLFLALSLFARNPARWSPLLAAVAFILPWVRLELLAVSLTATASIALIVWLKPRSISAPPPPRANRRVLVPFIGACLGGLIYFAYNRIVFGGFVPVSGAMKEAWSQLCFDGEVGRLPDLTQTLYGPKCIEREPGFSVTQNLQDFLQIRISGYTLPLSDTLLPAVEVCLYALLVWWLVRRSPSKPDWLFLIFLVAVSSLAVGHLAKFTQSVLTVHPVWGRAEWYFVPAYLLMALIIPVRCYVAIYLIRRFIEPRWETAAKVLKPAVVAVAVLTLIPYSSVAAGFAHVDRTTADYTAPSRAWDMSYLGATQVMNRVLPQDAIVGSWDSGRIGYFSSFPVVNLDGLVNSYDYLNAVRNGNADKFFSAYGITHFANIRSIHDTFDNTLFEGIPIRDTYEFKLWAAEPPESPRADYAEQLWTNLEPSFDYRQNNVGVMTNGRLAQVLVRDCIPQRHQDMTLAVSYNGSAANVSYHPFRSAPNHLGYCVGWFELPRHATQPLQIDLIPKSVHLDRLIAGKEPIARSHWDVYISDNSLVYRKARCTQTDTAARFFLHLHPQRRTDMQLQRWVYGFDNQDFRFQDHGFRFNDICVAVRKLPQHPIKRITTGQFTNQGHLWETSHTPAK